MFHLYLKKVILSPLTILAAVILLAANICSHAAMSGSIFTPLGGPIYTYQYVESVGLQHYFVPVVTILPICFIQYEMILKNAEKYVLFRSSSFQYILGGIFSAALSGMVIALLAHALFMGYLFAINGNEPVDQILNLLTGTMFENASVSLIYLRELFVICFAESIWPVIAYTAFVIGRNQYIAAALPFAVKYGINFIVSYLAEIIDERLWYLDPAQIYLTGTVSWESYDSGITYLLCYWTVVILLCTGLSLWIIRRRIRNG